MSLLPDRHPNLDFFVLDIADAVPKDDMASMEHPLFSLATKPRSKLRASQRIKINQEKRRFGSERVKLWFRKGQTLVPKGSNRLPTQY